MPVFIVMFLCFGSLWANQALDKLQAVYDKTHSFEAQFKQTYWNKLFDKTTRSEGSLSYQKPGKMRWDYLKPHEKSFILNQKTLWLVDVEEKTVQVNRCFQEDDLVASLVFLGGRGKLKGQFKVQSQKLKELVLIPKTKSSVFEKLVLVFDPKTHHVLQTTIIDPDGNKNEFKFEKSRYNHRIKPAQFGYKAAPDFELLEMPGSCSK